jgi:hypothetical protein
LHYQNSILFGIYGILQDKAPDNSTNTIHTNIFKKESLDLNNNEQELYKQIAEAYNADTRNLIKIPETADNLYDALGNMPKDNFNKVSKKLSLKIHPDKNRDNPTAITLFQKFNEIKGH